MSLISTQDTSRRWFRTLLLPVTLFFAVSGAAAGQSRRTPERSLQHAVQYAREVHVVTYRKGPRQAWKKVQVAVLSESSHPKEFLEVKQFREFSIGLARTTGIKRVSDFSFVFLVEGEPPLEAVYHLGGRLKYYGTSGAGGPFWGCTVPDSFKRWLRSLQQPAKAS